MTTLVVFPSRVISGQHGAFTVPSWVHMLRKFSQTILIFILLTVAVLPLASRAAESFNPSQIAAIVNALKGAGLSDSAIAAVGVSLGGGSSSPSTQVLGAAVACPVITSDLQYGSSGPQVVALQTFLVAYYGLTGDDADIVTGNFRNLTRAYVQQFQSEQGISPVSGIVGPKTRAAIARVCGGTTPTPSATLSLSMTNASTVPPQNIAVGVPNQPLGGFTTNATGEPISASGMIFSVSGSLSDLLTNVTLVDQGGSVVAGPVNGSLSNGIQLITFTDLVTFPLGQRTFTLRGKVPTTAPNAATLTLSAKTNMWPNPKGTVTGTPVSLSSVSPFTMSTMTVRKGGISIGRAASPTSRSVVSGGANELFVNFQFDATGSGEDVRLTSVPVKLLYSGGAATSLTNCRLFDGATPLNTGLNVWNPTGSFGSGTSPTTITLDNPLTIARGTVKTIGMQCNVSSSATNGSTYELDLQDASAFSFVGASSGSTIMATDAPDVPVVVTVAGTSLTVMLDTLPSTGTADGRLIRFKVTANPNGSVSLAQMQFTVTPSASTQVTNINLFGYSDANYSQPISGVNTGGQFMLNNLCSGGCTPGASLVISAQTSGGAQTAVQIPAGATRYFELRGSVSMLAGAAITTTLKGDPTYSSIAPFTVAKEKGYFIWSPNSAAALTDSIWMNGYNIPGLPSTGLTQSRSDGGPVPTSGLSVAPGKQPANGLAPQNALVPFTRFTLTNNGAAPVTVSAVTIQRTGLGPDAAFQTLNVADEQGTAIGTDNTNGPIFNGSHQATLGPLTIPAGSTRTYTITGGMAANLAPYVGQAPSLSLVAINSPVAVSGSLPITGAAQTLNTSIDCSNPANGYVCVHLLPPDPAPGCVNPPIITGPNATVGVPYHYDVSANGVTIYGAPVPSLPTNLVANGNVIEGTPTVTGMFSSKMLANNSCGAILFKVTIVAVPITPTPTCTLSVSPATTLPYPQGTATLTWSSTNATAGSINWPGSAGPMSVGANGSLSSAFLPQKTTTYTGTFTGAGGTATCSTVLNVTNVAPSVPVVTVPSKAYPNTVYTISFNSTDLNGDTVRYGIDDGVGTVHWWSPSPGYSPSGTTYVANGWVWSSIGSRTYRVLAEDSNGAQSAWGSFTVNVINPPTTGGGGGGGVQQ